MSVYELNEVYNNFHVLSLEYVRFLITVLTGYLLVAYYLGKSLRTKQIIVVNGFFIVAAALCIKNIYDAVMGIRDVSKLLIEDWEPDALGYLTEEGGLILLTAGVFVCLWFMWDVRHSNN